MERLKEKTEEYLCNIIGAEKNLLDIILESIGDGIIAVDINSRIIIFNRAAEQLLGISREEALGQRLSKIYKVYYEEYHINLSPVEILFKKGENVNNFNHAQLCSADGNVCFITESITPVRDKKEIITGALLILKDISAEKRKNEEITFLSYHDALTGLYNRTFSEKQLLLFDSEKLLPISIIIGDVNGLKNINDIFGHEEGDRMLCTIAEILKSCCRNTDLLGRWGGDEFICVLPKTDYNTAAAICEKIHKTCEERNRGCFEGEIKISLSLGYATLDSTDEKVASIIKKAEEFMNNRKLLESHSMHNAVIASIKESLFEKSHETEQHAVRIQYYCLAVGEKLNLTINELNQLELFALLHDIGKIAIDERILTKKGTLTDEEFKEIKKHPEIGYRITQSTSELSHVAEYILYHHERWDGRGYPQGLKEEEIPLLSRILAVVDAYDAMTNDRAYRKAIPKKEAVEELLRNSGTQFDPLIAKLFVNEVLK